ncbi:hypothetical protein GCM10009551_015720 [Nocardiopsis tropica]
MNEHSAVEAAYLTPRRESARCRLVPAPDRTVDAPTHPLLDLVAVHDEVSGRDLLRLSVRPLDGERVQDRARAFAALDNEILAGVRLARASHGPPPAELSRLVGYRDDPAEPFALLEPYRGEPLDAVLGRRLLFEEERAAFREGLFRALFWLQACDVVHRDIRPGTVRWDGGGGGVQVCGFTSATVAGVARESVGVGPWASHEQRAAVGRCDPRDDVWSAGLVLFQALSGHDVSGGGILPLDGHPGLAVQLEGVFAGEAEERPGAGALLALVSGAVPPHRAGVGDHLRQGRTRFRENRERKRLAAGWVPPDGDGSAPEGPAPRAPAAPAAGGPPPRAAAREEEPVGGAGRSGYVGLALLLVLMVAVSVALFLRFG